jgi:hypothetical protein
LDQNSKRYGFLKFELDLNELWNWKMNKNLKLCHGPKAASGHPGWHILV